MLWTSYVSEHVIHRPCNKVLGCFLAHFQRVEVRLAARDLGTLFVAQIIREKTALRLHDEI